MCMKISTGAQPIVLNTAGKILGIQIFGVQYWKNVEEYSYRHPAGFSTESVNYFFKSLCFEPALTYQLSFPFSETQKNRI